MMSKQISTTEETLIYEMHAMLNNLCGKYETHVNNEAIHQQPPCEHHKALTNRIIMVAIAAVSGLITAVWGVFSKGH